MRSTKAKAEALQTGFAKATGEFLGVHDADMDYDLGTCATFWYRWSKGKRTQYLARAIWPPMTHAACFLFITR